VFPGQKYRKSFVTVKSLCKMHTTTEMSPWEAYIRSAGPKKCFAFWNPKVHYSWIQSTSSHSDYFKMHFNIILPLQRNCILMSLLWKQTNFKFWVQFI